MSWTAPAFDGGIDWQNLPAETSAVSAENLNAVEANAASDARRVAQSVVDFFTTQFQGGQPPIGAQILYAGYGDPPEGEWVVADGRLINRLVYVEFHNRVGFTYNGGVDPGGGMTRVPDKRGRSSVGAINMGTGAATVTNARANVARGATGGEQNHLLLNTESSVNGNGQVGFVTADHTHSGTTGTESADHTHTVGNLSNADSAALILYNPGGLSGHGAFTAPGTGLQGTSGRTAAHVHGFSTGGISANHYHLFSARNADTPHNNLHPYETDVVIVRIA